MDGNSTEIAVFGGGCFWCTEAVFKMLAGVMSVEPGYAGGTTKTPTYEEVSAGITGHAECIKLTFNPHKIAYTDLLTVFFSSHDPTTLNRQGADIGTQYRSVIFTTSDAQKNSANKFIEDINNSHPEGERIVTEVVPLTVFYPAENYHKDYYERNSEAPYCQIVINPKLEKVQKQFETLLKFHPNSE